MTDADTSAEETANALAAGLSMLYRRMRQAPIEGELTLPERSALSKIDRRGPITAGELAKVEQISPQSIGATLATLEQRGMIVREHDPRDGRRMILSLTAAGRASVQAKRAAHRGALARTLANDFTPEERAQLLAVAPLLERLAERY